MVKKYYDSITDTIYGCEPNTISYYHEEGHRRQNKKGIISKIEMYQRWTMYLFFVLVGKATNDAILMVAYTILLFELYLEIDAWIFAIKKYLKIRKEKIK